MSQPYVQHSLYSNSWRLQDASFEQKVEIIYDAARYFVNRFNVRGDRSICANVISGLIKVTTFLLARQIEKLEKEFLEQGGLRERIYQAWAPTRRKQ